MSRRDHIDLLIDEWAAIRREIVGKKLPLRSADYLGAPRCSIGNIRDLHAGSRSDGAFNQRWPPFPYERSQNATMINFMFQAMSPTLKEIMDWHWVRTAPRDKRLRAELMGISRTKYWERVDRVKCYIQGGIAVVDCVRTVSPENGGINTIRATSTVVRA
jgi:hypothetical protein